MNIICKMFLIIYLLIVNVNFLHSQVIIDSKFKIGDTNEYAKLKIDNFGIVSYQSKDQTFISRIENVIRHEDGASGIYICELNNNIYLRMSYKILDYNSLNEVDESNIYWIIIQENLNDIILYKTNK